ncbi:hypothetical protein [Novosphingobium sp. HII-3]|uniref:hypothetical protein n=1 Tax=Novosphingobium sp. HII-3 TaxID=2075565 RepID=UPI0018ECB1F7|nr:hypothetical protein [Novosphingobium sp. HII-3]
MREGGGVQVSQDLSQIIASRYQEYANSAEFRALGAPSLQAVDLSPTQMRAREMIVDRIAKDYIDDIMEPVRDELVPPTELRGSVQGPSDFSEADLRGSLGATAGEGGSSGSGGFAHYADEVSREIQEGRGSISRQHQAHEEHRESAIRDAAALPAKAGDKLGKKWFEGRDR